MTRPTVRSLTLLSFLAMTSSRRRLLPSPITSQVEAYQQVLQNVPGCCPEEDFQIMAVTVTGLSFYALDSALGHPTYQPDDPVTLWVTKLGPTITHRKHTTITAFRSAMHLELELDVEAKVKQFKDAIENSYWFEFFIVLLVSLSILTETVIISTSFMSISQDGPKPLEAGRTLDMTYSVKWEPTNISFARRFEIHWFSILILHDGHLSYWSGVYDIDADERDVSEESGCACSWRCVSTPLNLVLLSALVGTGAQLALLVLLVILLAIVGMLWRLERSHCYLISLLYVMLDIIHFGYVSGAMYSRNGGKSWIKSMILTASLFHFCALNWFLVGRNWSGAPNNPCRVKTIPRPIPVKKWYLTPSVISLMGGLLPFGSIFIEMYFVFTSFWNYKTSQGTYFLLNAENYHWQWTSFFSAASTAVMETLNDSRLAWSEIQCDVEVISPLLYNADAKGIAT
ncbi:hypothetical protein HAX54_002964 [Datura stramonium]|uniref:Transmembrane 9 superfamily member n=1 Tax=Datura stramonium TaxID=4076 RepID=A0ABS8T5V4_DATST|nr:hypothetical protein [Datura stramonium]